MYNNIFIKNIKYGNYNIILETGNISKKSDSSILAKMGDSVLLVNIVKGKEKINNTNFAPITVNYFERFYSMGKIPNNFYRRETRQTENEIIISRLIDRSIRPLISKNYEYEIQITITVLSIDINIIPDILAIISVSAALEISDIPFNGPISSCRIGYINNEHIFNPSCQQLKNSKLDLILTITEKSIIMIELSSNFILDEDIINFIELGFNSQLNVIKEIKSFYKDINKKNKEYIINKKKNNYIYLILYNICYEKIFLLYENIDDYELIKNKMNLLKENFIFNFNKFFNIYNNNNIGIFIKEIEKKIIKNKILYKKIRLDNRNYDELRKISASISILPSVHGSSLFTRGETQTIVSVTLGVIKNNKNKDFLLDYNNEEKLIFHYNFPPYCVGEIGKFNFPKRREIGHGKLAKKSIIYNIPNNFPYYIRIVSEITESNGSSSMASVCGSTLSLIDAGVPIKEIVVGVAMGLINFNNKKYIILTDISGTEDFIGDLDFKISGTGNSITSLQLDTKIKSLNIEIIKDIIIKSKKARNIIINNIKKVIPKDKKKISKLAPIIKELYINKDKICEIIGKGGITIKSLISETNSEINIDDNGKVIIVSPNNIMLQKVLFKINNIINNIIVGKTYIGFVKKIFDYSILFKIKNNEGILNICKYNKNELNNFIIGQKYLVKIISIDENKNIKLILSKKNSFLK